MEQAGALAIHQEESDILRAAQRLEDAAQQEAQSQYVEEGDDTENIITGFYGSLGDRPS